MTKREYSEPENLDSVTGLEPQSGARKKRNIKSRNKRRFSDEQISSLETIFEADSKLEPRRKVQLARELGLQPRQVAIWFQNKRARWKSKQIEQDLRALRAEYDNLTSKFESLSEEKQNLITQLEKLNDLVGKTNCTAEGSSYKGGNLETTQVRSNDFEEELGQRERERESEKENYNNVSNGDCEYGDEGQEQLMNMGHVDACVSPHDWHISFDSGILFDPSRCNSQWFNFWT